MAMSRGSYTTEASEAPSSSFRSQRDSAPVPVPSHAACRALLSPIDASLALWGDGRRGRIAEIEAELRQQDAVALRRLHDEGEEEVVEEAGRFSRRCRRSGSTNQSTHGSCAVNDEDADTTAPRTVPPTPSQQEEGKPPNESEEIDEKDRQFDRSEESRIDENRGPLRIRDDYYCDSSRRHRPARASLAEEAESSRNRRGGGGGSGNTRDAVQVSPRIIGSSTPTTLEERLALWERGWRPPALRELPREGEGFFSRWTHLGQPERFELVKSANRSRRSNGEALTDAELEWAVLCLEEVEARMAALEFSAAANILEKVLGRCPGFTLAYYRLALCLLAARGAHSAEQARRLLDCAMSLEGEGNSHLRSGVDLVTRMLRNDDIPEAFWSEDVPKSLGDLRALEAALDQL